MLSQFFQKAVSMVDASSMAPQGNPPQTQKVDEKQPIKAPKRALTTGRLNIVDEADPFTPQRAEFIWLKLICATRDVGDETNMASMNEKQWQIGLNQYQISIEPGLSRKVFSMVLHRKGKLLFRTDFIKFVERQMANREQFDYRVQVRGAEVGVLQKDDETELIATLAAKIVHALLHGSGLDVFELMKGAFCIDTSASIEELLRQMEEVEWHNRIEIMEYITNSEHLSLSQADVALLMDKWCLQLSDERSQLVRVALETCPVLVERMVVAGIRVDVAVLLEGLVFPIRAKRSKELQRLGAEAGERLMSVFLSHFQVFDDEFSVTSSSALSETDADMDPLNCVIQALCAKILENDKYEIVRKQFLSYIIQLLVFYKESADASRVFDDEQTTSRIASTLNVTLNDKKPEVREESFRMMRLLDKMYNVNPFDEVKTGIETNILSHIDPAARLRFERKKNRAKRSRSTQIRSSQIRRLRLRRQVSDPTDSNTEAPERPKLKPNKRSNSVPVDVSSVPHLPL